MAGGKLSLRWHGQRRFVRAINDYTCEFKDICTNDTYNVHVSRLKFYSDDNLDKKSLRSRVFQSKISMVFHRFCKLVDTDTGLMIGVR